MEDNSIFFQCKVLNNEEDIVIDVILCIGRNFTLKIELQ